MKDKPKKTKRRALADYIAKYDTFMCGESVSPDGSNVQFSVARDRHGEPSRWPPCVAVLPLGRREEDMGHINPPLIC